MDGLLQIDHASDGVMVLHGEIDAHTASRLVDAVQDVDTDVVVDLGDVSFVDSTGLRALVQCGRRLRAAGGSLTLANVSDPVRDVISLSGLGDHLQLRD